VDEMVSIMSCPEFFEWIAFFKIQNEERDRASGKSKGAMPWSVMEKNIQIYNELVESKDAGKR